MPVDCADPLEPIANPPISDPPQAGGDAGVGDGSPARDLMARQQPKLCEDRRRHLLRFVADENWPCKRAVDVGLPSLTQDLRMSIEDLQDCLRDALDEAGAPQLMTPDVIVALSEHSHGNSPFGLPTARRRASGDVWMASWPTYSTS